ncbi:phytanoyl-CoA dioxygenase family protein [Myxococcota bacterium]|nr:phytanoyl-CoA dioxygenase family protein [Myxococcota bacterium]
MVPAESETHQSELTHAQLATSETTQSYWENGYLLLPGLFDSEALSRFEERFLEIASGRSEAPEGMIVMQDVMVARGAIQAKTPIHAVNKILSFENDPILFRYSRDPKLVEVAQSLIGEGLATISTNVFNKPPGVDGRHPLHQDLRYFKLRPADKIVGTWTAISACSRENGCLAVIPRSHRGGLAQHTDPGWEYVNYGFFAAEGIDLDARVHLEMQPGDTVLLHPMLIHGSGRNQSAACRRAISTHYASTDCQRPPGKRKREPVMRRIS